MNRSLKYTLWFIALLTLVGAWFGIQQYNNTLSDFVDLPQQDCRPQQQWCDFVIANRQFRIKMPQHILYLQPFSVTLQQLSSGKTVADDVVLNFQMPNMSMGLNQFMAEQVDIRNTPEWQVPVLLPVCASGRTGWMMDLVMSVENVRYRIRFSVQVEKQAQ